jgi:hypothetical protein
VAVPEPQHEEATAASAAPDQAENPAATSAVAAAEGSLQETAAPDQAQTPTATSGAAAAEGSLQETAIPDQKPPCCSSAGGAEEADEEPELDCSASQSVAASLLQAETAELPQCTSSTAQEAAQDYSVPASAHSGRHCTAEPSDSLYAEQAEDPIPTLPMSCCLSTPERAVAGRATDEAASRASEQPCCAPASTHGASAVKPKKKSLLQKAIKKAMKCCQVVCLLPLRRF